MRFVFVIVWLTLAPNGDVQLESDVIVCYFWIKTVLLINLSISL